MLRALIKLLRGVWHALIGFFTIYTRFPMLSLEQRNARVQVWAMQMLRICGIELRVLGKPVVSGPALLICNHISWLDILVIHATRHCRFVSKSELRDWPVLGTMATGAGTLYIDDDSVLVSVWRTLNAKGLQAVVNFGDLQTAQGRGRREWAHDLRLKVMQLKLACLLQSE